MLGKINRCVLTPLLLIGTAMALAGCPVWNSPGSGQTLYRQCRTVDRHYWLYIPQNYNRERRYPLVVSLHGMKPYDSARPHVEMWGKLADENGYIIVAPELRTSDSFGQMPLRTMGDSEMNDVRCALAIMDEVEQDWEVDRNAALLSSWSMGGYLGGYIATHHGERFAAYAPLQSNFSSEVLDPVSARRFARTLPIFVFYGTADLPIVTNESKEAADFFRSLGYSVQTKEAPIGHVRHPELAAQFFEGVLARRQKTVDIVVTPPSGEPAPLAVNLWPALSSKIGEVKTYIWEFERLGGPSYLKSPNVLIRQPGVYPVKLTVIDAKGQRFTTNTTLTVPAQASARRPDVGGYRSPN